MLDIDRGMDEKGRSIVTLRCKYPEVAKKVIENVLGEEYIEPEIEDLPVPERTRQWWQRSIDSGMGGRGSRDLGTLRKNTYKYTKGFQEDTKKVRERIYKEK